MTGDINLPTLPPAPATGPRPAPAVGELLKLLEPQAGLIDAGKTVNAEVLALKQGGEAFQLLLKLTLEGGRQTLVQAASSQPLPLGSNVAVSQTASGDLAISLQQALSANVAALTRIDTTQLPVGSLLQAKVLTSQMLPQGAGQPALYRSLVSVLNSALSGTTLTLESPQPLRVASLLSAVVQGAQTLDFVPLSGLRDQLAVSQQLAAQQSRQGSLEGLFNALKNLPDDTSAPLRAAVDRLQAGLPDVAQVSNPKVLAQLLYNSGVFLEAKLLAGQNPQVPPLDMKGSLLRLVNELLPALPASTNLNAILAANTLAQMLPSFVRSPLGTLGQVGARTAPGGFPLPERLLQRLDGENSLENLLRLAAGAISRLQSHQLSSLEQSGTTADGRLQTTWQLEIPMRTLQDIVPLQVKFQREEPPPDKDEPERKIERDAKKMLWRVELAFDMEPLGPLQVQAQLSQGKLSSQLWATRPFTASLIESHLGSLRERLVSSGLNVGDLDCHLGTPPRGPKTGLEQRWVDETA
ncbi:flagellar hook-length control protein FliK [Pseudomonas sp. WS 5059]|uniref:flagellar hook-length control protein FliK n=1 Tax=unclassified Pseudomonas TaxID=196821 RepID=UPI00147568E1|nr:MULTISPECIES: flagellar hook-length control protein FliK [unclassified Pseudomonas]NMX70289.1 flagellar hook-length control protein FliK [Pseudomonas sp. WS 5111]NMX87423.1 flagellar hook-length control protein FliK [Pseudomonas sp. WS 5010]NMY04419.1 flagellar hook-length control protein FliK [Pseudomonas sp. WS 5059]NMY25260.1 flagellar hook-length control protein FliK [Pseudomonas sp. WS 5021]